MWNWLKQVFNGKVNAKQTTSTQAQVSSKKMCLPISQSPIVSSASRRFQSRSLIDLWTQIEPISHKEYPFLDQSYSPASRMPAADFSPWLVTRLASDDWNSIVELLKYISSEYQLAGILKTFKDYNYTKFLSAGDDLLNELKAIAMLVYRIDWPGDDSSRTHLLSEIILHSLACHPFEIRPSAISHLITGGNKFVKQRNKEFKEIGQTRPLICTESVAKARVPKFGVVHTVLDRYPVTFRCCLSYSLERGSPVPNTIRPQMQGHYGLRQFGMSTEFNTQYLAECGLFEPPSETAVLANRLKKEDLVEIASTHGIDVAKSWKKERIVGLLMASESTHSTIAQVASRELIQVRPDLKEGFEEWKDSLSLLRDVAICLACV